MSVSIKTVLDENIHRFMLSRVSFEELERALFTIYGKSVFSIRYKDEDGDLISVSSTPELQEALRGVEGKTLKLLLMRGGEKEKEKAKEVAVTSESKPAAEKIDAKLLGEYQKELQAAQQELKQAAEASRLAKQAAAQAFWEAEETRERARKEAREREEMLFAKEQAEQQRREEEEAERAAKEQQLVEETLQKIAQEEAERAALVERHAQFERELAEKDKQFKDEFEAMLKIAESDLERQQAAEKFAERAATTAAATVAAEKKAKAEAFWEAENAREQAERTAGLQQEAPFVVKQEGESKNEQVCHSNVQCNLCDVYPIIGTRYQCTLCHDFDLCEKCEATPHSHPIDHPLLKHKQTLSTATVHHGVSCDNCHAYPIVGARFKCKVCPNFDLCADCESKDVHPADHPMFKFRLEKERVRGCRPGGRGGGFRGLLMRGAEGPRVRKLQECLGVHVDGVFGPKTEDAVKQFQTAHGLAVDGVVGPQTREKLGLRPGCRFNSDVAKYIFAL